MKTPIKQKQQQQVLPRLKLHLLQGKTITGLEALQKFGTMRLAEYIRILRHDHNLDIKMRMIEEGGKHFGEYYIKKTKKKSRITTGEYKGFSETRRHQRV